MRQVSIIALLIANAVQLGMMFAIMAVVALAGLVGEWLWVGLPANIAPITEGLKASSFFMSLVGIISVVPASLTAGYLAGRMAHRHPVLHGALSSAGWFIVLLVFILLDLTRRALLEPATPCRHRQRCFNGCGPSRHDPIFWSAALRRGWQYDLAINRPRQRRDAGRVRDAGGPLCRVSVSKIWNDDRR
jgi:hypothetical protein